MRNLAIFFRISYIYMANHFKILRFGDIFHLHTLVVEMGKVCRLQLPLSVTPSDQHRVDTLEKEPENQGVFNTLDN